MSSSPNFLDVLSSDDASSQPTNVSATPPSPDSSSPETPTSGVSATPDGPPQAPAASQRPSLWKSVLQGALAGLANSSGARSFASGAGAGAAGELNRQANEVAQQRQAAIDQQTIKFKNADEAYRAALLTNQDQELHNRTQEAQDAHDKNVRAMVDFNTSNGYADYDAVPNTAGSVSDYLSSQTAQNGAASVAPGTLVTTNTIYVPKAGPTAAAQRTREFNTFASAYGLSTVDQGAVSPANYQVLQNLRQGLNPKGETYTKDQLAQQTALMQLRIQRLPANADAAVLADARNTLNSLKAQQKSVADQAGQADQQKANIETNALNQRAAARSAGDSVLVADPNGQAQFMTRQQAEDSSLPHLPVGKSEVPKLRAAVIGANDVQTKFNELADALPALDQTPNDHFQQKNIAKVIAEHDEFSLHASGGGAGVQVPTAALNFLANNAAYQRLTPLSRRYVNALLGAREAITQLPRLQTLGQSSRVTQTQMDQAVKQLPDATQDSVGGREKMQQLQTLIDPIRRALPSNMPATPWVKAWTERGAQFRS